MISSTPPNKNEKHFHDWIRRNYTQCRNCFAPAEELHHIVGSTAKQDGVHIGQWLVGMLCYPCNHDDLRLPPKREQIDEWVRGELRCYWTRFDELPQGMNVQHLMAIACWSR